MEEVDASCLIAILQKALPDKLIIMLPSSDTPDIHIFYSDQQAVIHCESDQPIFIIYSVKTGNIVGWGQEPSQIEAIMSAYSAMRSQIKDDSDYFSAA